MFNKEVVVRCESGLHNRQATYFVQKANEYESSIYLESGNRKMNAKSLLGIHSPSTVFRDEVGGMIPPGLSEGVERKTPQAVDSVETMARKIVDAGNVKISSVISNTEPANMAGTGNGLSRDVLAAAFADALAKLPQVRVFSDPSDAAVWVGRAIDEQLAKRSNRRKVFA